MFGVVMEGNMPDEDGKKIECKYKKSCEMYELMVLSRSVEYWQTLYCDADFKSCARYELSELGKVVSIELLPNGKPLSSYKKK